MLTDANWCQLMLDVLKYDKITLNQTKPNSLNDIECHIIIGMCLLSIMCIHYKCCLDPSVLTVNPHRFDPWGPPAADPLQRLQWAEAKGSCPKFAWNYREIMKVNE